MKKLLTNSSLLSMIAIVVMSLVSSQMVAQTLYIGTGGGFFAKTGVNVYINGNTSADGQVDNADGNMIFNGDLTVNPTTGVYTSTGRDTFTGFVDRNINSAVTGTNYFGYLIKKNTGRLFLFGNTDCDSIEFINGIIDATTGVTVTVKSGLPTAIKGYNSLRYIDVDDNLGILSRNINSTSTYVFPIGNSTAGYRRFDMVMTSLGATGTSFLEGKLKNGTPPIGINFHKLYSTGFNGTFPSACTLGSNAQSVDFECMADHYWNFFGPSDYRFITLAYGLPCTPSGNGPRRVIKTPAGTGFWTANLESSIVGTVTDQLCLYSDWTASATAIPGGTYQGFGDFGIAGTFGAPLPVELLTFTVSSVNNEYLRLDWATASELNNAGFAIERSTGNSGWTQIGWVNGNGNSNSLKQYTYDDRTVSYDTIYYYRLKQTDFSGAFHYSWISSGKLIGSNTKPFSFSPNPTVNGIVTLYNRNDSKIILYDVLGKLINTIPLTENQFDISELANGTYYMRVIDTNDKSQTYKLLKIK